MVVMNQTIDASLDAEGLGAEQRGLLELIDKLQFAQLGPNVKLPQIVVVGDQSAGKSSVLEALTGTPFPREAGACTRFATEIRLRRSPRASLSVSVIPDRARDFREQEKLRRFGGGVAETGVSFEELMRQAGEAIAPRAQGGRFAARDILVVEKRGPAMPLLTLVDLPGLVRNANHDQSAEDIRTIEALSDRYMRSQRTIILAVVGGNSDYVQAPILTKARHFDPEGTRTIGVLTKPDLTESIGLEDKFVDLVQNKDRRNHFRLGWYVLLNPGPREPGQAWPTSRERQQREDAFFSQGKWAALPGSMCGASSLRRKLSEQLQRHIGRHVKTLRRQIQGALDGCEAELRSLGEGKDTPEEMRVELVELFSASKELVIPAVYGFYKNPPRKTFFRSTADPNGTPAQNLRARATEENDRFAKRIRSHGRKFSFTATAATATRQTTSSSSPGTTGAADVHRSPSVAGSIHNQTSSTPTAPVVDDAGKEEFVRHEVAQLLQQIRGSEFPMDPKPRAVYMLFQSYSEYWPRLAQEHKDNLGVVCNEFLGELIAYAWPRRMHEPLRRHFLDPQVRRLMDEAQTELERLVQDMHLEVQPYDPEYEERLRGWHAARTTEAGGGGGLSRSYSEAREVLEKMLIYYELQAKSFARNVIVQVVERHLLQGMYGIFDTLAVLRMDVATIEAIAAENRETRDRRLALKAQKTAIEEARDVCANLAMRKELRQYAEEDRNVDEDESSDEEDQVSKTPVTPRGPSPTEQVLPGPSSSSRQRQRASRPTRDDQPQLMSPPPRAETSTHFSTAGTSSTPQIPRAAEPTPDLYTTTARSPPTQAPPPPPPRPEKVRTGLTETASPAAVEREQQQHDWEGNNNYRTSSSGNGEGMSGYRPASGGGAESRDAVNEFVQSATRRNMRKILGRG